MKTFLIWITILTLYSGAFCPVYSEESPSLKQLRISQDQEYIRLRELYDRLGAKVDKNSPEYQKLREEYSAERTKIREKYTNLETRGQNVEAILNDRDLKGRIQNTGSMPASVNADVDLKATDLEAAEKLADKWSNQKGKKQQYYTVDNPTTPTTTRPKDFNKVIKVVNPNTDTTLWTPGNEKVHKAKVPDPDAWTTSGGLKGTGNLDSSRDKRGYYLDNEKKFHHADRPITSVAGAHDEELKTFSKSVSKAGGSKGANIAMDNPEFYQQAEIMQKYGDPVQAGIVDLGDPPDVRIKKIEAWKQKARDEMEKAKRVSQQLGDAAGTARDDLAQQMRDQGHADIADRIDEKRRKVADSNRAAAAENKRLKAERDAAYNDAGNTGGPDTPGNPPPSKQQFTGDQPGDSSFGTGGDPDVPGDISTDTKGVNQGGYGEIKVNKPGSAPKDGKSDKIAIQDIRNEIDPETEKIIQEKGFGSKTGGIQKDPKTDTKWVKDPELGDLGNPNQTHGQVTEVDGNKKLSEVVTKTKEIKQAELERQRIEKEKSLLDTKVGNAETSRNAMVDDPGAPLATGEQRTATGDPGKTKAGQLETGDGVDQSFSTKQQSITNGDTPAIDGGKTPKGTSDVDLTSGTKKPVKSSGLDVDAPNSKGAADVGPDVDVLDAVEAAGQIYQSATNVAGEAIDQNRDLNSGDAATVAGDLTPGIREYQGAREATKDYLVQKQLERLERQEQIRKLEEKKNLTPEEEDQLHHLKSAESRAPDTNTVSGAASALITDTMDGYIQRMRERKKAEAREGKPDNWKDGMSMAGEMASDTGNAVLNALNPLNPFAESLPETATWDERQAWASQKDMITKYLNSEATKVDKASRRNADKLNQLLTEGDLSDPEVQKSIDALLAELRRDRERLADLNGAADGLPEVDPEKLKHLRDLQATLPDIDSMEEWRNQLLAERERADSCPKNTVRLNDQDNNIQCVSCEEVENDFNASLNEGYRTYAESLISLASTCAWTSGARERLLQKTAGDDCSKQKPGSSPVFSGDTYKCRCPTGSSVDLKDETGQVQCVSCDVLHGDFDVALGANEKEYAQALLEMSVGCGWIAEGQRKLDNYGNCPDSTVRLSDESNTIHCVSCEELQGDFTAALEGNDREYAQMLIDVAPSCGWVVEANRQMERTKECPAHTVKLSDQADNVECVYCDDLYGDFNAALASGDQGYARTLLNLSATCGWVVEGNKQLRNAQNCPANAVKLSDNSGQNHCVPCDELYGDFSAALSGGDRAYAETLADLGSSCGWSSQAWNVLNTPQSCPEDTVMLSDQQNQIKCVPCSMLYGDYSAALQQGDSDYADTLVNLASACGWAQSVAGQNLYANQQAEFDQRCNDQVPGSSAVINGDRYSCYCPEGMLTLTNSNGSSCQSCEQIRGYINSALQRNDLSTVRGLMSGAQSCGWYNEAVQVVAGIERDRQNQKNNQFNNQNNAWWMRHWANMMNEMNSGGSDDIPPEYYEKRKKKTKAQAPPPKQPVKKTTPPKKTQPPKKQTGGCIGGPCCKGHTKICSNPDGTKSRYPHMAIDRNEDGHCDICGGSYSAKGGGIAPGLKYVLRGNGYSCK